MSNVLKDAMLTLYRDSPEILYCLQQLDYSALEIKFINFLIEFDARIDRKTYEEVEKFLASDEYMRYCVAVSESSMSMTRDISKMLEFVLHPKEGELN